MENILEDIENHPVLGLKRKIELKGIEYLDVQIKEMRLVFLERFVNEAGEILEDESINPREIRISITNNEKVTEAGITITLERVKAAVSKKAGETDEAYETRVQNIYQNQLDQGTPKFKYYLTKFGLGQTIRDTIGILKVENQFDNRNR